MLTVDILLIFSSRMFPLLLLLQALTVFGGPVRKDYEIWCTGNCDHDVETNTKPGAVLMGGGVSFICIFARALLILK